MVSESILIRLLGLSNHPQYKFHARVKESWCEGYVLEIPHRLEMRSFNNLLVGANLTLQASFVRLS